jgi:eukaryotic-like serine/threonine-protein kinase
VTPEQLALTPIEVGPAGTGMVYYGQRESTGGFQLWFRRYDDLQAAPIANAAGGADPAISPDGSEVVFQVGSELRVVPLGGGVPRTVVDSVFCCASWNPDGQSIFYTQAGNKVVRVPTDGGARELVLDATGEPNVAFFRVTPSGRSAVFTSFGNPTVVQGVELESGERTVLSEGLGARVTGNGHLVFASPAGELLAAPYAESPMRLTGAPVPLVAGVFVAGDGTPRFSLNEQGTLAYWEGEGNTGTELVWVTRDGAATHVDPNWTFNPGAGNRGWSLSPDGSKVEIRIATDAGNDIWIKELDNGPLTRLSFWGGEDRDPKWLPDSRTVTFLSAMPFEPDGDPPGDLNLWRQVADGSRPAELLFDHEVSISEAAVAPDGKSAVIRSTGVSGVEGGRDIFMLSLAGEPTATPLLMTPFDESAPQLSPDGRWLAYQSNESGRDEVYVRPYPETDNARVQVSVGGGLAPRWAKDGSELFFLSGNREMMAAAVSVSGGEFRVSDRPELFELSPGILVGDRTTQYDVDNQGRFLMLRTASCDESESGLVIVRNFVQEVKTRVGSGS